MSIAPEWLVEVEAHTGAGVEVLRLSAYGFTSQPGDTPSNEHYAQRVSDPGYLETSLFGAGRTMGAATISLGEVVLSNADGKYDNLLDYSLGGRPITIKRISPRWSEYSNASVVFSGTVQAVDSEDSAFLAMRIRLYDRRLDLNEPIQTNRYGGTVIGAGASADGTADLKDKVKPLLFGRCYRAPAVSVNPHDLIYQVNDGPVHAVGVYDGGAPLREDGDTADLAALQSATILPGRFKTCLALGLFRLGGQPAKTVTADVDEGATASDRTAAQITMRMLAKMGFAGADLDAASFAALDAVAAEQCGIFIDAERGGLGAMQDVLSSVGGWIVSTATGLFSVGRLSAPGVAVATFGEREINEANGGGFRIYTARDDGNGVPAYRVNLSWRKQWHQYGDGEVVERLSTEARDGFAKEWLEVQAEDLAVQTVHLLAPELAIETLLTESVDATNEAARRLALYSVRRNVCQFDVPAEKAEAVPLGSTVKIVLDRFDFDAGRDMVVIGVRKSLRENVTTLTVWG